MIFVSLAPLIHCNSSLAIVRYLPLPLKFSIILKSLTKDGLFWRALSNKPLMQSAVIVAEKQKRRMTPFHLCPPYQPPGSILQASPVSVQCTMYRIFCLSIPIPKAFVATTMSKPFPLSSKKASCTRLRSWDSSPA